MVTLRFIQGIALGGEWGGASLMVVEHAPTGRRGLFGSLVQIGFPLGLVTSSGVFALVTQMPDVDFKSWGWRIPFLLSILLIGVGWFVRARVPETPVFEEIKRRGEIARNPFVEAVFKNPRSFLVAVGLKISEVSWVYILTIFIVVYATSQLGLPRSLLLNAIFIAALVEVLTIPLFGWLSDHVGRRVFYFLGTLFTAAFAFPLFWLLGTKDPLVVIVTVVVALSFGHVRAAVGLLPRAVRHPRALQWGVLRLPDRGGTGRRLFAHHRHGARRHHGWHDRRIHDADPVGSDYVRRSLVCEGNQERNAARLTRERGASCSPSSVCGTVTQRSNRPEATHAT